MTVAAYNREQCPREGELMTAAESTSTTAPKEAPMLPGDAEAHASTSADIAAARPPIITVMHASVGSGHKAAANAVAQAIDRLRGTHGIPNNVIVDVIDILDYGRIKFDGNKTAASFTASLRRALSPGLNSARSLMRSSGLSPSSPVPESLSSIAKRPFSPRL